MTTKPPATVWIAADSPAYEESTVIGVYTSRDLAVVGAAQWSSKNEWAATGDIAIWREQVIDELPHAFPPTALVAAIDTSDRVEADK